MRPRKHTHMTNNIAQNGHLIASSLLLACLPSSSADRPPESMDASTNQLLSPPDVPTAKQIARFYLNANKSARVKSTCLETITESGDEDCASGGSGGDTQSDAPTSTAELSTTSLGDQVNFLNRRKLRRSLTFTTLSAGVGLHRSPAAKTLVQRRRRRIREKLGTGVAYRPVKFSMAVFMEKMRAMHEADELDGGDKSDERHANAQATQEVAMDATMS